MGATTPAPKSHRRIAPRRHAAVNAAQRPPVAPAERVGVVHLTAEYWPFARTGGLGEAGSGLATPEAQLLHAHDWHTALAPVYLRTVFAGQPFHSRLASVLSVHNAGFQGHFAPETMADLGLPPELYSGDAFEWYGRMNMLKGGLAFSDVAVTVSPTHARELCTPEGGFGLHDTFIGLGDRLAGILNGIDPDLWNPTADPQLTDTYWA